MSSTYHRFSPVIHHVSEDTARLLRFTVLSRRTGFLIMDARRIIKIKLVKRTAVFSFLFPSFFSFFSFDLVNSRKGNLSTNVEPIWAARRRSRYREDKLDGGAVVVVLIIIATGHDFGTRRRLLRT